MGTVVASFQKAGRSLESKIELKVYKRVVMWASDIFFKRRTDTSFVPGVVGQAFFRVVSCYARVKLSSNSGFSVLRSTEFVWLHIEEKQDLGPELWLEKRDF